ncbi:MAG: Protein of unknown function (DUF1553)/Protein of unknown function (DUF1549)/Planctomycete, partial [Planctomycetaceae bacterium]|nr:Protein of unknown function (DUF1553)/Protein of unknown function (DUF1549)/Planctomycete [Planctomycetaceae bacterium]
GPALESDKPAESLLLEGLRYESLKMPPQGKLPANVIADFEAWVKMGAPDPRVGQATTKLTGIDVEAGRQHWSYRPLKTVPVPQVRDGSWPLDGIDRFILAGLEAKGLTPVTDADRVTLIRRVYFDLIGLPPAPEEIDTFVNDARPDAYELLVDRLLSSPQFGERWGRHWLDVVRFGESLTLRGFVMPEAWRYRDYVIEHFNADRPYDQFLREQVAGDLLPSKSLADRQRQAIATTFLVLGNTNLEEQDKVQLRMDVVDEQLDVITKGFLAQTVTCARCHDHKFDPIPTRDYYAMAGILRNAKTLEHANVSKWLELALPVDDDSESKFHKHETLVAGLQDQIKEAQKLAKSLAAVASGKGPAGAEVVAAGDLPGIVVDDAQAKKVGDWKFSQSVKPYIGGGYVHDLDGGKGAKTLTFQPELPKSGVYEVRLAYTAGGNRTREAPVTVFSADGEKTLQVNEQLPPPIEGRFVSLGQFRFEQNGQGFVIVGNEGTKGHVIADAVQFLSTDGNDAVAKAVAPTPDKTDPKLEEALKASQHQASEVKRLEKDLQKLTAEGPKRPRFMSVEEEPKSEDCAIHIRGTVHNLGAIAPRGFMSVVSQGPAPTIPASQSGRRELGDWLASTDNPLPPRVMANRIWHWLLGSGLVRTVDNFGTTGEAPSHPELLDYLATQFVADGWSTKSLIRQIVLSRTYRLSSVASPQLSKNDPENRLLGHGNRRRQDAECLLDAILAASGQLDLQAGGSTIRPGTSADYGYQSAITRRAVYWPVLRNALPELFEVFDFPDPSMVFGRRNTSTVAPQALFLMNNSFVQEQSRLAAVRLLKDVPDDDTARVNLVFRRLLGRFPSDAERVTALKYVELDATVADFKQQQLQRWGQLIQALFGSVDFRYVN